MGKEERGWWHMRPCTPISVSKIDHEILRSLKVCQPNIVVVATAASAITVADRRIVEEIEENAITWSGGGGIDDVFGEDVCGVDCCACG